MVLRIEALIVEPNTRAGHGDVGYFFEPGIPLMLRRCERAADGSKRQNRDTET